MSAYGADSSLFKDCVQKPNSFLSFVPEPNCFPPSLRTAITSLKDDKPYRFIGTGTLTELPTEKLSEMRALIATMIESSPIRAQDRLYLAHGLVLEKLGQLKDAETSYREGLKYRQNNPLALFRIAAICHKQGKYAQAIEKLKEVHWRTKHLQSEVFFAIGASLNASGKAQLALPYLREASFSPGKAAVDARRLLVGLQLRVIENLSEPTERAVVHEALIADLHNILAHAPDDRDSGITLGNLLIEKSDPLLHATSFTIAEQLGARFAEGSDYNDIAAVRLLFDTLLKKRALERAKQVLDKGLRANPEALVLLDAKKQLELEEQAEEISDGKTPQLD
jgi:tetratricopeptide (TPR) repeat protein